MKAWVLYGVNDLRFEDRDIPEAGEGQALIRVKAAGICGSDIPRAFDTGAHKMPLIIGHEFAGIVEKIGSGVQSDLVGKRVGIFPLLPCRKCGPCLMGKYEMCRNYDYLGSRSDGGFAEYVTVPADNLIELPGSISFEAGAMLEPMAVAVHALRRGLYEGLSKDSVVVVCGLGTIGFLIVMFLLDMGYRNLYVIGNKESQKKRALDLGLSEDRYLDGRLKADDQLFSLTSGADLFFECVGRNECASSAVNCCGAGGHILYVGNPHSDMLFERNVYWKILRNQLVLGGTWNSSFDISAKEGRHDDDWSYALDRVSCKGVNPDMLITHRFPLAELDRGLKVMRDKTEDFCKVMCICG